MKDGFNVFAEKEFCYGFNEGHIGISDAIYALLSEAVLANKSLLLDANLLRGIGKSYNINRIKEKYNLKVCKGGNFNLLSFFSKFNHEDIVLVDEARIDMVKLISDLGYTVIGFVNTDYK